MSNRGRVRSLFWVLKISKNVPSVPTRTPSNTTLVPLFVLSFCGNMKPKLVRVTQVRSPMMPFHWSLSAVPRDTKHHSSATEPRISVTFSFGTTFFHSHFPGTKISLSSCNNLEDQTPPTTSAEPRLLQLSISYPLYESIQPQKQQ